ncbi:MAG: hypothetical protein U0169_15610 [Polyangiaceae bacterium]
MDVPHGIEPGPAPGPDGTPPRPAPVAARPAAPKGRGCLRALAVLFGIASVVLVVLGVVTWRYAKTPEGSRNVGMARGIARLVFGAFGAPGTKELKALGCAQAFVMSGEAVEEFADEFYDAGPAPPDMPVLLTCQQGLVAKAIPCDDVARTYQKAVPDNTRPIEVSVMRTGSTKPLCRGSYSVADHGRVVPRSTRRTRPAPSDTDELVDDSDDEVP